MCRFMVRCVTGKATTQAVLLTMLLHIGVQRERRDPTLGTHPKSYPLHSHAILQCCSVTRTPAMPIVRHVRDAEILPDPNLKC